LDLDQRKMSISRKENLPISLVFDDDNISSIAPRFCNDYLSCMTCVDGSSDFCSDIDSLMRTDSYISSPEIGAQSKHGIGGAVSREVSIGKIVSILNFWERDRAFFTNTFARSDFLERITSCIRLS
jgi:hypothetical protein